MRTTITIDDGLHRKLKAFAARSGRTVSEVVEDAVVRALSEPIATEPLGHLPVYGGTGTLPGIDLSDSSALRDVMDEGVQPDALR